MIDNFFKMPGKSICPGRYHNLIKQKIAEALVAVGSWSAASGLRGPELHDECY